MARVSLFEILKMVTTKVICKAYLVKMHFYLTVKVVVIFARPESPALPAALFFTNVLFKAF